MAITATQRTDIVKVVVGLFNAAPGATYLNSFTPYAGNTAALTADLVADSAFQAIYPTFLTSLEFGTKFVDALVGNAAAAADKAMAAQWIAGQLDAGASRADVVTLAVSELQAAASDAKWANAAKLFANKVAVAEYYSVVVLGAATDVVTLQSVLSNVSPTTDVSTPAALQAVIDAAPASASGGQVFTLTKSVQALTGTSGNDTFVAGDEGGSATLNAGDQISGGAGTDTLKLFNAAGALNAANFALATISGVENVEATLSASAQTLNVSGNADVKNVSLANGFDGVVSLKLAQAAGLTGTIDTTGAAATFTFVDNAGGADAATLNLNNAALLNAAGAGNGVIIAGVETLNIAATGTNVLGNLAAAATTKLVVTGAGSVNTTLTGGATKTIDGSVATGNLVINNAAAAAAVESIKTGSGNDIYTTQYANLTKDDVIDLGTGTDSLRFSDAATFNDAATKARLEKVTGVEQLGTVNALLTVDGDFVSQTSYYTNGAAGDMALTNIANNADVNFGAGAIQASAVGMKLGANTLNVNLAGSATAAADLANGLAVTGSATINVNSTGTDGQPDNVLSLTAADNQSVVVTGSQNLTLTATAATGTTGFSIDGSAFTGKLTVTGTAASDIVKGGSGADTISGGAGAVADTLTGGAGNDKFIVIAGITAATADVITDFVTKADKIDFNAGGAGVALAAAGDYTEATASVADFAAALAAANLVLTNGAGTKQVNVQQVGSDSWVFFNDGGAAGADQVVKLTGVALTGIEFGDILA